MYELTVHVLHQLHLTAQLVPMETITEWMDRQFKDIRAVIISGVGLLALCGASVRMVKSHFSIGSIITTSVMLALCAWLVAGEGAQFISDLLAQQAKAEK